MTGLFQRAVRQNVARERRQEAIDTLVSDGRTTDLGVLVRTRGLPSGLRRQALDGLVKRGADEVLAEIAADRSVPEALRQRAERK